MKNNVVQVGIGAKIFVGKDGNIFRVSIFDNGDNDGEHIQLYAYQANQLLEKLQKELEKDDSPML